MLRNWRRVVTKQRPQFTTGRERPGQRHRRRLALDRLEDRTLLSAVGGGGGGGGNYGSGTVNWVWTGAGGDGLWDHSANWTATTGTDWSGGQIADIYPGQDLVAGENDVVSIDTGATAATITVQPSDYLTITGLTTTANDTLALDGTMTISGSATLAGPLSLNAGNLTASGAGVQVDVNGAATATGSSLSATDGALLSLPGLTSFDVGGSLTAPTISATGTGSVLDLSALTALTSEGAELAVAASGGGTVNLSGLTSLNTAYGINITDVGGSTLLDPNVTTLTGVYVTLDGTDAQVANSWTKLIAGSLNVSTGTYTLPGLTDVDQSSLDVTNGGSLSLPNLKSYVSNGTFQADGRGSGLDLPALTTVTPQAGWVIDATDGGTVNLSGLTDLSSTHGINITDTGGSTLLDPNVTTLTGVHVTLDGTDAQVANSWTKLIAGALTVNTGAYSLPGLTDVDQSGLYAMSGGSLTLPNLTSYVSYGNAFEATGTNTVTGTGSMLDVSALASVSQLGDWLINAAGGGAVNLSGLATLTSTNGIDFVVGDSESTIELPSLTSISGSNTFTLQNGAVQTLPVLTAGNLTLSNGESLTIQGTVVSMPAAGTSGTTINVPQSTGLAITFQNQGTFTGGTTFNVGQGSTVNLSGGTYTGGATFNVAAGATVDLTDGTNVNYGGTLTGTGAGTVQLSGGGVHPANGGGNGAGNAGLTLNFPGSMFQWTGGAFFAAAGNVTNLGTVNLAGATDKGFYQDGTLYNEGTFVQTGAGNLDLHSDSVSPTTFINDSGATYLIEGNSGIDNAYGGLVAVQNAGIIRKTAGTGTSTLNINGPLTNTGTIEAASGTLDVEPTSIAQIAGSSLSGGTWNAGGGATLQLPSGTNITSSAGSITLSGAGAAIPAIAGLTTNTGSLTISNGATFTTAGDLTNSGTLALGPGSVFNVHGNATLAAPGTLDVQLGGTPASGQYGQLAVTGTAALAGSFGVALTNGFGPSAGDDFAPLTYGSVTGSFGQVSGLSPFFTAQLNASALDLVDGATNAVDLVASDVAAPVTATSGQAITVTWQVSDPGSVAASGNWQDSVYLSTTPSITSNSVLLGTATHSGGLAAGGSYTGTLTAEPPALAPGYYYVLVQADSLSAVPDPNRANNTAVAATGQLDVSLPSLTLGQSLSGTFTAASQDQYYQVTVPAGGTLQITLSSVLNTVSVALYVSRGSLPSPYNFQEAAATANQSSQTVTISEVLTAGTYDILAHGVNGVYASSGYTLTATQSSRLSVNASVLPYSGGNAGNATIEIDGTNFTPSLSASLSLGGTTIPASAIDYVSASQIFATFDLTGAPLGGYQLTVAEGTQSAVSPSEFHVVAAVSSSGLLQLGLSMPPYIRTGRTATFTLTYTNPTNNDMVAPVLVISSTDPNVSFSAPDDPSAFASTLHVLAVAPSGPAGILLPGQTGTLTLALWNNDPTDGAALPVSAAQIQSGQTMTWSAQQGALQPAGTSAAAWNAIWGNLMTMVGTTTDSYNAALAQAATYLSGIGDSLAQVSDVNLLWAFLESQADAAFPATTLASSVDAGLATPGSLSLALDRTFVSSLAGREQAGMFGLGWVSSWETSLTTDSLGDVTIGNGQSFVYFALLPNGTYQPTNGVTGTLTLSGAVYTYTDTSGLQFVFQADGKLGYEQDLNGNRITLGYNGQNQLATLTYTNPSNPSEPAEQLTLSYNAQGFVSQVADGTGATWSYAHDSAGHLLSVTAPGDLTTSYTYDTGTNPETQNALLSITAPDGSQQNFTYDAATGRLTGTSQNAGADPITYSYPGQAEVVATDAAGHQSTVWFNELGLAARVLDPLGGVSTYQYDLSGRLTAATDPAGNTYQYTYDRNGNLTQSINPLGQTNAMTYNSLSELTSLTDAAGNRTQYNYSATGNLLSIAYPDGTAQSFTYDPLGNLASTVLQNGVPIGYQTNAQGLMTGASFADGTSQTFSYDSHGNLLSASTYDSSGTLTGTTTLTYNAAFELTSITYPPSPGYPSGQSLTFTYNSQGQRIQSVDQDGYTIKYTYDVLGRLSELTDGAGNLIVLYGYNNLGELQSKLNGNGTSTTYAYDAAGDLTQIVNLAPGGPVNSSFTYTYNSLGEITSETDASGNVTTYGYDALGQLTSVGLPGGATIQYVYNAAGDRTEVVTSGTPTTYASNASNEITQAGGTTFTYDPNGNLRTSTDASGTTTYTYNDLNQLVSIAAPDGSVTTFQYSPLGFLTGTAATAGGVSTATSYLVDPTGLGNVVASYDGSGNLIAHYTYGLGLVSQTGPGGTGYYDYNAQGNTVGITSAAGTYVNQYRYLPFGETTTVSATLPNPFTFAGQAGVMQVGTDLFSMRARMYTPVTGQFLSNDPLGLAGGDVNVRRYVGNSPTNGIDPSGMRDVSSSVGTSGSGGQSSSLDT